MAEPEKMQFADGSDDYLHAANEMAKIAKNAGRGAEKAAVKSAQTGASTASATVKAGLQGGKAVSGIAAGTAAGGPLGTILSTAWLLRHTMMKILICIILGILFFVILIVSIPSIVSDAVFGINGTKPLDGATLTDSYIEMSEAVSEIVDGAYDQSLAEVERIIERGGYDYKLSMEALINHAQSSAGYDVSYILAAYSASLSQRGTSKADMVSKLSKVAGEMFLVTYEEKQEKKEIPVTYSTYKEKSVTVVTKKELTGTVNGKPRYRYETATETLYVPEKQKSSDKPVSVNSYSQVTVDVPVYSSGKIVGTNAEVYYRKGGKQTISPDTEIVKYVECTIHPFNQDVVVKAFGIDLDAKYDQFDITYREAIQTMASALKMTLYGRTGGGKSVPLTDAELIAFVERQNCNATRKHILTTALSLVGKVPYFWGGKSAAGWNDEWNTPKLVTAAGSPSSGTIRPYGLDCSGYTNWVYKTALGISINQGSRNQWESTYAISKAELLPGDIGFLAVPGSVAVNHVLLYAGKGERGEDMWVHCSSGSGVVLNSPKYVTQYRRLKNVDYNMPVAGPVTGDSLSTIEVDVTHYCACSKCCGGHADGYTASGKKATRGMVAMSSHYPFGTQIMINGTMYTVEDRGGTSIENNIHRVDIFVPDHNEALRLGRFKATATIYRLGR